MTTTPSQAALKALPQMRHRDLQRECIIRGLPPMDVVTFSHPKLVNWFVNHYDNPLDNGLLLLFDAFVGEELIKRGYKKDDILLSPALRFSVTNVEDMTKIKVIKPNGNDGTPKTVSLPEKVLGVRGGTKKAMTFELASKNVGKEEIVRLVTERFPEANAKSIKIWIKKYLKEKG